LEPDEYDPAWERWTLEALPIVPKEWKRKPKSEAREQIKVIKGLLKQCSEVVNAGDPDREGQLLVDEVLEELGCNKPVKRIWLAATDEKSVEKALANLRDNTEFRPLKDSAEARSWGDWLVGMNATRKMTLLGRQAGMNGVLSVGRVQTPTLALVVGRDQAIENFKPKDYYVVVADVLAEGSAFKARWVPADGMPLDEAGRLLDRSLADAASLKMSGKPAVVARFEAKEKSETQPLAFSLDKLQMECNKRFGLSAQQTLEIAQELYESKLVSYPRTDSGYLPESQFSEASGVLSGLKGLYPSETAKADVSIRSSAWNDAKVTAHHGIIPTGVTAELSGSRLQVFDLIVRRYLAQFYPPYKYLESIVELSCEGEKLTAKGRVPLAPGWKSLFKDEKEPREEGGEDQKDETVSLPHLQTGQTLLCQKAEVQAKKTTAPPRFTEGSLLQAMLNIHNFETDPEVKKRLKDSAGIGTPATRANIIETLKKRGFIEEKKKSLVSTDTGRQLISVLPLHMKSPGLTALFEQLLESVASGGSSKESFLEKQTAFVTKFVKSDLNGTLKPTGPLHTCPECKKGILRKRPGANGAFWGCSAYPDCKATFQDKKGRPDLTPKPKVTVSETEKCSECGKGLIRRAGKKGFFWGCSGYPSCKATFQDAKGKPIHIPAAKV
jgi:DNA topoisomerase-3